LIDHFKQFTILHCIMLNFRLWFFCLQLLPLSVAFYTYGVQRKKSESRIQLYSDQQLRSETRVLSFTEDAAKQILKMREKGKEILRIGVRSAGGCAEYSYIMDLCSAIEVDDMIDDTVHGFRVAVDQYSLPFLSGVELSYQNDSFVFNNPNAASSCNCGNSFTLLAETDKKA